jgi:hypothetical protein
VAGALIGWAIGRTVGISFRDLMNRSQKSQAYNFYLTPTKRNNALKRFKIAN